MASHPTHAKSPWTSKVNSFLYESLNTLPLDGILLDHRPSCIHRFDMVDTEPRGDANEAQGLKPSKTYAWKRSKKWRRDEGSGRTAVGSSAGQTGGGRFRHRLTDLGRFQGRSGGRHNRRLYRSAGRSNRHRPVPRSVGPTYQPTDDCLRAVSGNIPLYPFHQPPSL